MNNTSKRPFILNLLRNCKLAQPTLDQWRAGEISFEVALITITKDLYLFSRGEIDEDGFIIEGPRPPANCWHN